MSGYLTSAEALAIELEEYLEKNEQTMPGGAAIAATCELLSIAPDLLPIFLAEIPQGEWWTVANVISQLPYILAISARP